MFVIQYYCNCLQLRGCLNNIPGHLCKKMYKCHEMLKRKYILINYCDTKCLFKTVVRKYHSCMVPTVQYLRLSYPLSRINDKPIYSWTYLDTFERCMKHSERNHLNFFMQRSCFKLYLRKESPFHHLSSQTSQSPYSSWVILYVNLV